MSRSLFLLPLPILAVFPFLVSCTFQVDATDYVSACESGFMRCFANRVEVCNASGNLFLVVEDCEEQFCRDAQCVEQPRAEPNEPPTQASGTTPSPRVSPGGGDSSGPPGVTYVYPGVRIEFSIQVIESLPKGFVDVGFCEQGFVQTGLADGCMNGVFLRIQDLGGGLQAMLWRAEEGKYSEIEGGLRILERDEILRVAFMFLPPVSAEQSASVSINLLGGSGNPGLIPTVELNEQEFHWFGFWNLDQNPIGEAGLEGQVSSFSLTYGEEFELGILDLNAALTESFSQWSLEASGTTAEFFFSNLEAGYALYPLYEFIATSGL